MTKASKIEGEDGHGGTSWFEAFRFPEASVMPAAAHGVVFH
jgi:hypothetical protein